MSRSATLLAIPLALLLASLALGQSRSRVAGLNVQTHRLKHYDLYSDCAPEMIREAAVRSDVMVAVYAQRTRGFSKHLTKRLPLYLLTNASDYHRLGALPGSAGTFVVDADGDSRLLVLAGGKAQSQVWNTLQHEGFHQFAHAVIGGDLPMWVNEGLAEYFGDAIFTGDSFVDGIINPAKLRHLRMLIENGEHRPLREIMLTTRDEWNARLSVLNYLQAWSMVHFLAHADPRYQSAFDRFILDVSRGLKWDQAWPKHFGTDIDAFEQRWREYWQSQTPTATLDRYTTAAVRTYTNFYARARSQLQRFESPEEFFAAARDGTLKTAKDDWLPPSLAQRDLEMVPRFGEWTFDVRRPNSLTCVAPDGTTYVGTFELASGRVKPGSVKITTTQSRRR